MKLLREIFFVLIVTTVTKLQAQHPIINILDSGRKTSLRGLSVVNDNIVWASGSSGTVAKSTDGGRTFEWITVQGYEQRDFRDVEAFDASTALIMAVAEPAIILKTKDGGKTWKKVFEDTTKGMFLDAMDFTEDKKHGIVIGDPIKNYAFVALTEDSGETWKVLGNQTAQYKVHDSEAFFAASGTNVKLIKNVITKVTDILMVSGGKNSTFFLNDIQTSLPIVQGEESTGANSLAVSPDYKTLVIVGGDFKNDKNSDGNFIRIDFDSAHSDVTFKKPQTPPHGYRSCVEYITENKLITCGTSGVDISKDGGMNWELISTQSFHVCQKAKKGSKVFLAGSNGKIAVLSNF